MNTILKTLALIAATGFPVVFTAESLGVAVPTAIDSAHAFGAFVATFMVLTVLTDYGRTHRMSLTTSRAACAAKPARTALPLAA